MYTKNISNHHKFWLFSSLVGIAILYLNLTWKTTGDLDQLTTESLFWGAIFWLLWRKKDDLDYRSDPLSSFIGLLLLGLILSKAFSLFWFESILLPILPLSAAIALGLIASGLKGLGQYLQELFFVWFLFFPSAVIGFFIDGIVHITVLNAQLASYFLYYIGFNAASQGNQVLLSLPESGNVEAIVNYSCAGIPMILLMLKLSLLLVSLITLSIKQKILIPMFSVGLGFFLGVIRVCILTLSIPNPTHFNYWHGAQGSQIFSTLAIAIFAGFCYLFLETKQGQRQVISNK